MTPRNASESLDSSSAGLASPNEETSLTGNMVSRHIKRPQDKLPDFLRLAVLAILLVCVAIEASFDSRASHVHWLMIFTILVLLWTLYVALLTPKFRRDQGSSLWRNNSMRIVPIIDASQAALLFMATCWSQVWRVDYPKFGNSIGFRTIFILHCVVV
jgi:hypothetical protein